MKGTPSDSSCAQCSRLKACTQKVHQQQSLSYCQNSLRSRTGCCQPTYKYLYAFVLQHKSIQESKYQLRHLIEEIWHLNGIAWRSMLPEHSMKHQRMWLVAWGRVDQFAQFVLSKLHSDCCKSLMWVYAGALYCLLLPLQPDTVAILCQLSSLCLYKSLIAWAQC